MQAVCSAELQVFHCLHEKISIFNFLSVLSIFKITEEH